MTDEVDLWMRRYDNPMRDVVQRIRRIILSSDDRVSENLKWSTPTFSYKGDIASIFPKTTQYATVMFHKGGLIPGRFPHLIGQGTHARAMRIVSIQEAEERRDEINAIIQSWIEWKELET